MEGSSSDIDELGRTWIALKNSNGDVLYENKLKAKEKRARQYLAIQLDNVDDEFFIEFMTATSIDAIMEILIYNVYLVNIGNNIQESKLPEAQERVYVLNGSNEYTEYTGGYTEWYYRYFNNQYIGETKFDIYDDYIELSTVSNGLGYSPTHTIYTSYLIDRGEYTKLKVEMEGKNADNYNRPCVYVEDENGNMLNGYLLNSGETLEKNVYEIDLTNINTKFRIGFTASSVLGGQFNVKVYNAYFTK